MSTLRKLRRATTVTTERVEKLREKLVALRTRRMLARPPREVTTISPHVERSMTRRKDGPADR